MKEDGSKGDHPNLKTVEQGASTTVLAVVAPELENRGGLYLNDCKIAEVSDVKTITAEMSKFEFPDLVADYAVDEVSADRLWDISEKAISK